MFGPRPKRQRLEFQPGDLVVKILVSTRTASKIIGTGGAGVKALRAQSGVTLHIWENKFRGLQVVVLGGPRASVDQGVTFVIEKLMEEAQAGSQAAQLPGEGDLSDLSVQLSVQLLLTPNTVSKIIGAKGTTIAQLRQEYGCHLEAEKVPYNGEQVLKVTGQGDMVQQLVLRLAEFVEGAGDSQQVANNDYGSYGIDGGGDDFGTWSKGSGPKGKGGKSVVATGTFAAPMATPGKGHGGYGPSGHFGEMHSLLQAEQDPSVLSSVSTIQFAIPAESVSRVLGKGGIFSKEIGRNTGVKVVIDPPVPGAETCVVTLTGQVGGVNRAHCMVVSRLLSQY
ncbi:rnc1 [Symbiodinium natans]|uniref:Rnc1 protein n=1 Tax=Symbiodinium natans TaxID=878477 RepID=A0A812KNB5_9DINO|nr:rnc1 [Symbiodinium natans]